MAEKKDVKVKENLEAEVSQKLEQLDADLEIMERHEATMQAAEEVIQEDARRRDREVKDAHLHSVPRPRKHLR